MASPPPSVTSVSKKTIATFNALHLGDNLIHLHFMRAMAKAYPEIHFTHGAPEQYLGQLGELVGDLPNLTLTDIAQTGQGAINAWRGAGGWFYQQPDCQDFVKIHLRWFALLAETMGLRSPFTHARDLLFDYPKLKRTAPDRGPQPSEILVINSPPMSGQASGYSSHGFDTLIDQLTDYGHHVTTTHPSRTQVPCTQWARMSVTAIGQLSQTVGAIIGVPTGPVWPTFNVWNQDTVKLRLWLLDHEQLWLSPNTEHTATMDRIPEILRKHGLL